MENHPIRVSIHGTFGSSFQDSRFFQEESTGFNLTCYCSCHFHDSVKLLLDSNVYTFNCCLIHLFFYYWFVKLIIFCSFRLIPVLIVFGTSRKLVSDIDISLHQRFFFSFFFKFWILILRFTVVLWLYWTDWLIWQWHSQVVLRKNCCPFYSSVPVSLYIFCWNFNV